MGRHDWYRSKEWNPNIEAAFEAKIARARDPRQYLRIQAHCLAQTHPDVALALLDRLLTLPPSVDTSLAHFQRAEALLLKGEKDEALAAYRSALEREREFPNARTSAYLQYPLLVAVWRRREHYQIAREVLKQNEDLVTFPVDIFRFHAALSLIESQEGDRQAAIRHAQHALEAATLQHSGFRYHAGIGLVTDAYGPMVEQLRTLSEA